MKQHAGASHSQESPVGGATGNFLPNFCSVRSVLTVVVGDELLALLFTLVAINELADFLPKLSLISLLVQWIGLSTAGVLCASRRWLNRLDIKQAALLGWLVLLAVTALISWLALLVDRQLMINPLNMHDAGLLLRALGASFIVGLMVLLYLELHYRWRQKIQGENAAQRRALQARIRPHFLFNSMNTIASLTRTNPALAEEVVQDLADLFRVSMRDAGELTTLEQELAVARQYLNIESLRLGDRLKVVWDLQDLPQTACVPPLVLQPLLENAVYHGIEPSAEGGTIQITGRYQQQRIKLNIRNSLPQTPSSERRSGNQLAMDNIRARLANLFEGAASLNISEAEGTHQVLVVIPHPWSRA